MVTLYDAITNDKLDEGKLELSKYGQEDPKEQKIKFKSGATMKVKVLGKKQD
jgi:hypothetical protein